MFCSPALGSSSGSNTGAPSHDQVQVPYRLHVGLGGPMLLWVKNGICRILQTASQNRSRILWQTVSRNGLEESVVLNNHRQHISLVVEKLTCKSLTQGYPSFSLALTGDLLLCVPG